MTLTESLTASLKVMTEQSERNYAAYAEALKHLRAVLDESPGAIPAARRYLERAWPSEGSDR